MILILLSIAAILYFALQLEDRFKIPSPPVAAFVRPANQEFIDEVTFGTHDLDAVIICFT